MTDLQTIERVQEASRGARFVAGLIAVSVCALVLGLFVVIEGVAVILGTRLWPR